MQNTMTYNCERLVFMNIILCILFQKKVVLSDYNNAFNLYYQILENFKKNCKAYLN